MWRNYSKKIWQKLGQSSNEDVYCSFIRGYEWFRRKVGVEDNSVAAVVCTKLLCSLTEEQIAKTVQEVKRVLMPVSIVIVLC